ncbi:MAG: hypothetical protein L0Z49_06220 [Actinobacteria bacterium]|nr:hypothetical protein [Actinomycetota bacterium]MCI0544028.1 hypothetical protein [Actinomycetota bacterium]MCI0679625.1 hypothetical protein [Actinomycetota bacterium]
MISVTARLLAKGISSIAFDSTTPHRLFNRGEVPVQAIWFVVGRENDTRLGDANLR